MENIKKKKQQWMHKYAKKRTIEVVCVSLNEEKKVSSRSNKDKCSFILFA
jgi:predicted HAD superfamily phosphohydrolase YqeG